VSLRPPVPSGGGLPYPAAAPARANDPTRQVDRDQQPRARSRAFSRRGTSAPGGSGHATLEEVVRV
jgi:hypothetical protein